MTPHNDDGTIHRQRKTGEEQIFTSVEAVDFLLKAYATDSNIAQTTSDIACVKKSSVETSVQFADVHRVCKLFFLSFLIEIGK